jgi:hypothetical protein
VKDGENRNLEFLTSLLFIIDEDELKSTLFFDIVLIAIDTRTCAGSALFHYGKHVAFFGIDRNLAMDVGKAIFQTRIIQAIFEIADLKDQHQKLIATTYF